MVTGAPGAPDSRKSEVAQMSVLPENYRWQPVPGASSARFMPLLRPSAAAGCNVYLVEYPELFLLVDLGVDPLRMAELADIVNSADPPQAKPLLLILTHCHIDHILSLIHISE